MVASISRRLFQNSSPYFVLAKFSTKNSDQNLFCNFFLNFRIEITEMWLKYSVTGFFYGFNTHAQK